MDTFFNQLFSILTNPPGNLVYHIILTFSVAAALQAVLMARRNSIAKDSRRIILGLLLLLAAQVTLFIVSGLAWQGLLDPRAVLPPLDRMVTLFSLIFICWLWAFPAPSRLADALAGVLSLGVLIFGVFTLVQWPVEPRTMAFNQSWYSLAWALDGVVIILASVLALILNHPDAWEIGLGILLLQLIGFAAQLIAPSLTSDFSGPIRLVQLCAYPLLAILAQRLNTPGIRSSISTPEKNISVEPKPVVSQQFIERRRYSADPRAVYSYLKLATESSADQICPSLTRAVAQTMLADLCLLITGPSAFGDVVIEGGFDLLREESVQGATLNQAKIPAIALNLQKGRAMRIDETISAYADLQVIGEKVGLKKPGNGMLLPLNSGDKIWGGLLLIAPYSNRVWNNDDQAYLMSSTELIVELIRRAATQKAGDASDEIILLKQQLDELRQRVLDSESARRQVEHDLEILQTASASNEQMDSIIALQKESSDTIFALQAENERLEQMLREAVDSGKNKQSLESSKEESGGFQELNIDGELRLALEEIAYLQGQLAKASELVSSSAEAGTNDEQEVIHSIAQELRQPMASIIGYTDLLLTESAGILGALQRKFLERVKASTERMRSLLEDLIHLSSLKKGPYALNPEPVDVGSVIDQAINDTSAQLREKKIGLRVDLPDELPQLFGDRDAFQQIVIHLLQNAGAASPAEGAVVLRVKTQLQEGESFLFLQVIDSGGGIAPDDLPRVFARRYKADNPLIQGVGDTGVGLSIVKTLVEAHGGRIWVESAKESTTTFSVLLPLNPKGQPIALKQE